jgi:hypothetical protein
VIGTGPFDLIWIPPGNSNVELQWEFPDYARFSTRLASFCRLICLDKRGTGLSDRGFGIPSLEQRMDDIRGDGRRRFRAPRVIRAMRRRLDEHVLENTEPRHFAVKIAVRVGYGLELDRRQRPNRRATILRSEKVHADASLGPLLRRPRSLAGDYRLTAQPRQFSVTIAVRIVSGRSL